MTRGMIRGEIKRVTLGRTTWIDIENGEPHRRLLTLLVNIPQTYFMDRIGLRADGLEDPFMQTI